MLSKSSPWAHLFFKNINHTKLIFKWFREGSHLCVNLLFSSQFAFQLFQIKGLNRGFDIFVRHYFSLLKKILFEWSYFTMLCLSLLYSRVDQLYVHIYPLFSCISFPFRSLQSTVEFLVLHSTFWAVTYFIHHGIYMSIFWHLSKHFHGICYIGVLTDIYLHGIYEAMVIRRK